MNSRMLCVIGKIALLSFWGSAFTMSSALADSIVLIADEDSQVPINNTSWPTSQTVVLYWGSAGELRGAFEWDIASLGQQVQSATLRLAESGVGVPSFESWNW